MVASLKRLASERPAWPWLLLMMLFPIVVSVTLLLGQSLRLDEAQSFYQTARTPSKILQLVAEDVHVPLYHLMLHVWTVAFGNGVATARVLSLLFLVATIPLVYQIGKEHFSRNIGLTAALLFSISPFLNWYGNEIRMYTLLTFMTTLNQLFFLRAWKRGGINWLWYGLTAMVGVYSHYFFFFVLLTQAVFYLTHRRSFAPGSLWRLAATAAAVVIGIAPWLLYVAKLGFASGTKPLLLKPTTVDLFNTFSQFIFGFQTNYINTIIVSLWPLTVLLAFLTLQRKRKMEPVALYFVFAAFLPILFAFGFSLLVRPFFVSRYLIVALPALYLFIAWVISSYSRSLRALIATILVLSMAATLAVEITSPATPVKENYKGAATYLNTKAEPQDIVLVSAPFTIYPIEYYYTGKAAMTTLPLWDRFVSGSAPSYDAKTFPGQVKQVTADKQYAWVLLSYDQGYEQDVKRYFENHYQLVEKHVFSNDLTLYKYKIRYDPPVELVPDATPAATP